MNNLRKATDDAGQAVKLARELLQSSEASAQAIPASEGADTRVAASIRLDSAKRALATRIEEHYAALLAELPALRLLVGDVPAELQIVCQPRKIGEESILEYVELRNNKGDRLDIEQWTRCDGKRIAVVNTVDIAGAQS